MYKIFLFTFLPTQIVIKVEISTYQFCGKSIWSKHKIP